MQERPLRLIARACGPVTLRYHVEECALRVSCCCSWDHPQPLRVYGHRCAVGVNRHPPVCRHGQDAMTTERQPAAVLLLCLMYAECAGSCVGTKGNFHRHQSTIVIFLLKKNEKCGRMSVPTYVVKKVVFICVLQGSDFTLRSVSTDTNQK